MPPQTQNDSPADDWSITFAYWGTILVAGALFAVVALAPKFRTLAELRDRYTENQLRLAELERQAIDLEKIAAALENDPAFRAQLASAEFALQPSVGESIAVAKEFYLGAGAEPSNRQAPLALTERWSVPRPLIELFATNQALRATFLAIAGTLAVFALLFLNEEHAPRIKTVISSTSAVIAQLTNRYRKA